MALLLDVISGAEVHARARPRAELLCASGHAEEQAASCHQSRVHAPPCNQLALPHTTHRRVSDVACVRASLELHRLADLHLCGALCACARIGGVLGWSVLRSGSNNKLPNARSWHSPVHHEGPWVLGQPRAARARAILCDVDVFARNSYLVLCDYVSHLNVSRCVRFRVL